MPDQSNADRLPRGGDAHFSVELLDQNNAAKLLKLSVRTLERHRVAGTGPRFARLGRLVRYRECDLIEWVERCVRRSTSEDVR
jgi:predicted DNA-binding transcriptional regulator AlpA